MGCDSWNRGMREVQAQLSDCTCTGKSMYAQQTDKYVYFQYLTLRSSFFPQGIHLANYSEFLRENGQRFVHKQKNSQERNS